MQNGWTKRWKIWWTPRKKKCWKWRQHVDTCCPDYVRVRCTWVSTATDPGCSPSARASAGKLAEPSRGQHSLLGVQSVHLGRHDPKAHKGGSCDGKPTKQRKYKYESREVALAERNKRRNRAQKEQRRCVHQCLMAAASETTSKWQK